MLSSLFLPLTPLPWTTMAAYGPEIKYKVSQCNDTPSPFYLVVKELE